LNLLNAVNGVGHTIQQQTALMNSTAMLGSSMSCPAFDQAGVAYNEVNCVWGKFSDGNMRQSPIDGDSGYKVNEYSFAFGRQKKLENGLIFGQAFRFARVLSYADNYANNGNTGELSAALKYLNGGYTLAGSVGFGLTQSNNSRMLDDGARVSSLTSKSNQYTFGARIRNAYQIELNENNYLRPYLDVDLVYNRTPSYQEGGSEYALNYANSSKFNLVISPMVEYGSRINFGSRGYVRPYVAAGFSFLPNNNQATELNFVGANSGTFTANTTSPSMLGKAKVGVQVFDGKDFDVKLEFGYQYGSGFISQSASAKLSYRF
jgi:hypothetical protein